MGKRRKIIAKKNLPEAFAREIALTVHKWRDANRVLVPQFITHEIITLREASGLARTNENTEFFKYYAYKGHRQDVGSYISKEFPDADDKKPDKKQYVMDGFEYVQRYYIVKRDGDDVAVPVDAMTDVEIDARTQLLRRRGQTCLAHADELARYKELRRKSEVA